MGGSLLSKFKRPDNKIHPAPVKTRIMFPGLKRGFGKTKLAEIGCSEEGLMHLQCLASDHTVLRNSASRIMVNPGESGKSSKDVSPSNSGYSIQSDIEALVRTVNSGLVNWSAPMWNGPKRLLADREMRALESAREILAFQDSNASSSSTIATHPLNSTRSVLLKQNKGSVAFEVLVGDCGAVCTSGRMPRRLRRLTRLPQRGPIQDVNAEALAAQETRLNEMEHAQGGAGESGLRSAEVTADRIKAQQAADTEKWGAEMESRRQAGRRASRIRNRITEARDAARAGLQSSIEHKMEESAQRRAVQRRMIETKRREREQRSRKAREKVGLN